jgi:hypothetical protein
MRICVHPGLNSFPIDLLVITGAFLAKWHITSAAVVASEGMGRQDNAQGANSRQYLAGQQSHFSPSRKRIPYLPEV